MFCDLNTHDAIPMSLFNVKRQEIACWHFVITPNKIILYKYITAIKLFDKNHVFIYCYSLVGILGVQNEIKHCR